MNRNTTAAARVRASLLPLAALAGACFSHSVQSAPIEIKPIHITMDINLRVQRELDEFFDFEEPAAQEATTKTDGTQKEKE
jgi:hypothetical protein